MYDYLHMFRHLLHNENVTCRQKLSVCRYQYEEIRKYIHNITAYKNICKKVFKLFNNQENVNENHKTPSHSLKSKN